MNKIKLIALTIVLTLIGAACSSNETGEAEPVPAEATVTEAPTEPVSAETTVTEAPTEPVSAETTVTEAPTEPVPAETTVTEAPTDTPTEETTVNAVFDCDDETEEDTVEAVVGTIIYCLRQAPQSLIDEALNMFVDEAEGVFDRSVYNRLTALYGSEAVLVLTSSALASIAFAFNEAFEDNVSEEIEDLTEGTQFDECVGDEVLESDIEAALDVMVTCVREASSGDLQLVAEELSELFGEDNAAELVQLYGIEATLIIPAALILSVFGELISVFSEG